MKRGSWFADTLKGLSLSCLFGMALLGGGNAEAAENPLLNNPNEQVKPYQTLSINIDGDPEPEYVGLAPYNFSGGDYLGQIVLFDHDGKVIWAGPRAHYQSGQALRRLDPKIIMDNPLIFGKIGQLEYDMKFVFDPDKDGNIVVVIGENPRGVQISTFRVLRWNGSEFVCVEDSCHLIEDPLNPDHYVWSHKPLHSYNSGYSDGRWVRELQRTDKPNILRAVIREIRHNFSGSDHSPKFRRGEALLVPEAGGMKIYRWEHTLQKWFKIE
ncbi:hypothetical protein IJT93_06215 [bacterium]|nr:hypothetical protein [bacterium]